MAHPPCTVTGRRNILQMSQQNIVHKVLYYPVRIQGCPKKAARVRDIVRGRQNTTRDLRSPRRNSDFYWTSLCINLPLTAATRDTNMMSMMHAALAEHIPPSELLLRLLRSTIRQEINGVIAIPILPQYCPHPSNGH